MKEDWSHLKDFDLPEVQPEDVGRFIGQNIEDATLMTRKPAKPNHPVLRLTPFGWVVKGRSLIVIINRVLKDKIAF